MSGELNPCLCGNKLVYSEYDRDFYVGCPECGRRTDYYEDEQEAIDAWNKRANEQHEN